MKRDGSGSEDDRLIYGCMRIAGDGSKDAEAAGTRAIRAAIDGGYRWFDHADIYGNGSCEALFGKLLRETPSLRDKVKLMSKCGIRFAGDPDRDAPKRYDLSRSHIIDSVESSLRRLGTDFLDLLLLHRPDYLMDAAEVGRGFETLYDSGKVLAFGVSNFSPPQVARLIEACPLPIVANQLEISLHNPAAFGDGALDQCQQLGMVPQAWAPLKGITYAAIDGEFTQAVTDRVQHELERQSAKYSIERWVVALAWLLRHPSGIAPIIGSLDPERIRVARSALHVDYVRDDWYRLLAARLGREVP